MKCSEEKSAAGGLVIIFIAAVFFFHQDVGMTWDEPVQLRYGELCLSYYQSFFQDTRCNTFLNLRYYGPIFETFCAFLYQGHEENKIQMRHFCIGITAILTLVGLIGYAYKLKKNSFLPLFSGISLLMLPRFIGHAGNNSKDIPFAAAFCWGMLATLYWHSKQGKRSFPSVVFVGVTTGITLSLRMGGVLLLVYSSIVGIYGIISRKSLGKKGTAFLTNTFIISVISGVIMVLFWPWLHENPLLHPFVSLTESMKFHSVYPTLFAGDLIPSNHLPRRYLLQYLLITTPPILLLFSCLGIVKVLRTYRQKSSVAYLLLGLWLFFPLAYFFCMKPNVYDGIRHFLFILPAIALFSGLGAEWMYKKLAAYIPTKVILPAILVLLCTPLYSLITLHPYQMTYFNAFAGKSDAYETDYWLASYKEAAEWVNQQVRQQKIKMPTVLIAGTKHSQWCAAYYLDQGISSSIVFQTELPGTLPAGVDYYIATSRYQLHKNFPDAPIVHTIGRQNKIFTLIKEGNSK